MFISVHYVRVASPHEFNLNCRTQVGKSPIGHHRSKEEARQVVVAQPVVASAVCQPSDFSKERIEGRNCSKSLAL